MSSNSPRTPNPVDLHVGNRVKQARIAAGLSQKKLGQALGISFQQVQKYENGKNRIAPSRLTVVAQFVKREAAWFFEGAPGKRSQTASYDAALEVFASTREGHRFAKAFLAIRSKAVRDTIVRFVVSLATPKYDETQTKLTRIF